MIPKTKREVINDDFFIRLGVNIKDLAKLVVENQKPYIPQLTIYEAQESVKHVLDKREVQHAFITAITLDMLAEQGKLDNTPLGLILKDDAPDYGIDEQIAISVAGLYGSIAVSNFGMLDKEKPGIIAKLDYLGKSQRHVTTMVDDLACAVVAGAAARLAHKHQQKHLTIK